MGLVTHNDITLVGLLNLSPRLPMITIASGSITMVDSYANVETEGEASSDDLAEILGGEEGSIIVMNEQTSVNDITFKHGTTNLFLDGQTDKVFTNSTDKMTMIKVGSEYHQLLFSIN